MNTFTWKIAALDVAKEQDGMADVVVGVHYIVECSDGVDSVSTYGSIACGPVDQANFTAFPQLTEAIVVAWVKEKLDEAVTESNLANHLEQVKNPPVVSKPLPWATE